jgi:hypothetical protein
MRPRATRSEVREHSVGGEILHAVQSDSSVSAVGHSAVRKSSARLHHLESIYRWMLQSGKSSVRRTPLKEALQLGAPEFRNGPAEGTPRCGVQIQ